MKIAVFGPQRRVGIVQDDTVVDANGAYSKYLAESKGIARSAHHADAVVPANLNDFIEEGDSALSAVRTALEYLAGEAGTQTGPDGQQIVFDLAQTRLHPPLEGASRIFAALANFSDHMQAASANTGDDATLATIGKLTSGGPKYFMKDARSLVTDGDEVRYPARTNLLDYEAEVAIVIGKRGRDIGADDVQSHIYGYVLANDFSIRDNISFGPDFQYSKNFDTGTGLGPWILVDDTVDPRDVPITLKVNGEVRQDGNTVQMVHSWGPLGAHLSRDVTLYPGDVVLSGTPKGTAVDSSKREADGTFLDDSKFLRPGDVVEVSSPRLGSLTNEIVKAG